MSVYNKFLDKRLTEASNELYRVIYEAIYSYETRGFNAHSRAQQISAHAITEMRKWIEAQPLSNELFSERKDV